MYIIDYDRYSTRENLLWVCDFHILYDFQRRIRNPVKYLRRSIFAKTSVLDIWQSFEHAFDLSTLRELVFVWRSYEIISENYFCIRHKNSRKHNQSFQLLFFKLNSPFCPSNHIHTCRKLNLLFINSIILSYPPYESKEESRRPKYTSSFLTLSESKRLTNLQKKQLHKMPSPVCMS